MCLDRQLHVGQVGDGFDERSEHAAGLPVLRGEQHERARRVRAGIAPGPNQVVGRQRTRRADERIEPRAAGDGKRGRAKTPALLEMRAGVVVK